MPRSAALSSPRRHSWDICLDADLIGAVGARSEFDQCVKWNFHPRTLFLRHVEEIGIDTAKDSLVSDNDNILAALQLHDDWLETDDDITIRFDAPVAEVIFIIIATSEVLG